MSITRNTREKRGALFSLTVLCALLIAAPSHTAVAQPEGIPDGFTPLFNGENLSGWHKSRTNHHGTVGHFFAEDGELVLKQRPFGQGGILLTDKTYGDFELYLEFQGDPGTDGGILFRSNESGSAYQIQIGGGGNRGTGTLMGEVLHVTTTAEADGLEEVWKSDSWNSFRLRVVGAAPHVTLWVNGTKMYEVQAERNDLIAGVTEGMIALQLHWSQPLTPVPGGSCCAFSWRPGAEHRYRHIGIKRL